MSRTFARRAAMWGLAALCVFSADAEKPRKPKPALPAAQYPMHDAHTAEQVIIAAEPADAKALLPDTRLDYFHHGLLPIRVIVTNDSDNAISLDDARIQFISANGDVLPAATDEELERRLFSGKSTSPTKIPLPPPLPPITIHHKPVDQKILADETDFGFTTTTVEPHSTLAGYLYYDVKELDDPVLKNAQLEVRKVRVAKTNKELYSFQIALKPTPDAAKPAGAKPDAAKPDAAKPDAARPDAVGAGKSSH